MQQDAINTKLAEFLNRGGYELRAFYSEQPQDLFPLAQQYPEFFNDNLVSPLRVIKKLAGSPHSNIRVFYFQLLRFAYEFETEDGSNKLFVLTLKNILCHPDFEILFTPDTEDQRDLFNDFQFKKLFAEFLIELDNQETPNIEAAMNNFPFLDIVLIHIFRSILATHGLKQEFEARIPTEIVFGQLCTIFNMGLTPYGNCWKFDDSDMFCLESNQQQLFLAYMVDKVTGEENINAEQAQIASSNQSSESQISNSNSMIKDSHQEIPPMQQQYRPIETQAPTPTPYHIPYEPTNHQDISKRASLMMKDSMISVTYEFVDFTNTKTVYKDKVPKHTLPQYQNLRKDLQVDKIVSSDRDVGLQKSKQSFDNIMNPHNNGQSSSLPHSGLASASEYDSLMYTSNKNSALTSDYAKFNHVSIPPSSIAPIAPSFSDSKFGVNSYNNNSQFGNKGSVIQSQVFTFTPPSTVPKFQTPSNKSSTFDYNNNNKFGNNQASYGIKSSSSINNNNNALYGGPPGASPYKIEQPNTFNTFGSSVNTAGTSGDYYRDFTDSFTLDKVEEPFKSNIRQIKNRIKMIKRPNIAGLGTLVMGGGPSSSYGASMDYNTPPIGNAAPYNLKYATY